MTEPKGFRLECAETCRVYLKDDTYYSTLEAMKSNGVDVKIEEEDNTEKASASHVDYLPIETEPNFLVPIRTEVGELTPLYFRSSGERIKDAEAFGIALPPELLEEFQAYIVRNGMLEHARRLIYEEKPFGNSEHRLYKLNDGMTWGCKCQNNMHIHHTILFDIR